MADSKSTVKRFASALDNEDYRAAEALIHPCCVYSCRGQTFCGPVAIIAAYQGNGDAAKQFDSISYKSTVNCERKGKFRIQFVDLIEHKGNRLTFRSEQVIDTDNTGLIVAIEHCDLPKQLDALQDFRHSFPELEQDGE